jgi:hypothetical protein
MRRTSPARSRIVHLSGRRSARDLSPSGSIQSSPGHRIRRPTGPTAGTLGAHRRQRIVVSPDLLDCPSATGWAPTPPFITSTHWSDRRWSPPSSTRREHSQHVTGLQPDRALVGHALSPVLVTLGQHRALTWCPRITTPLTPRPRHPAFGDERHRAIRQHLEVTLDALPAGARPAPPLPRCSRAAGRSARGLAGLVVAHGDRGARGDPAIADMEEPLG